MTPPHPHIHITAHSSTMSNGRDKKAVDLGNRMALLCSTENVSQERKVTWSVFMNHHSTQRTAVVWQFPRAVT
jgi:hypothetical protein